MSNKQQKTRKNKNRKKKRLFEVYMRFVISGSGFSQHLKNAKIYNKKKGEESRKNENEKTKKNYLHLHSIFYKLLFVYGIDFVSSYFLIFIFHSMAYNTRASSFESSVVNSTSVSYDYFNKMWYFECSCEMVGNYVIHGMIEMEINLDFEHSILMLIIIIG